MGIASFEKGVPILIDRISYVMKRKIDGELWQVEEGKTGRIKELKIRELQKLYQNGALVFADDSSLSPLSADYQSKQRQEIVHILETDGGEWELAKEARQYVLAVKDLPTTEIIMVEAIRAVWDRLGGAGRPPHWTTVSRWKQKYRTSGNDIFGLKAKHHLKGNRCRQYPKEVLRFVDDSIELIYMAKERGTIEDALNHAIVAVERENKQRPSSMQLPVPTRRLVTSAINSIPAFDKHAARYSHSAAIKKFRAVLYRNISSRPLECAEMDHTRLDLFVVDDETGIPWGRPWLTICIDSYTRCILGIYIGFEPPSFLTVARCLKQAFMPKVDLHEIYPDIDNTWDSHGVMERLIVDNGVEFHSDSLDKVCFSLGIDLQFTPRKTPWWKGKIERFNGTLNRAVAHGNPGTTFANFFEKDDYNPVEHAVISLRALKTVVNKWIVDVYHQRPHRSLDKVPPAIKWTSSIAIEDIKLPDDPSRVDAIMGKVERRVLTHKGIEYEGLLYNCSELTELRRKLGEKLDVELRVDGGDLGHIHVIAPDKSTIIRVPCLDFDYANGITSWQHKLFKRYATQHLNLGGNPNTWRHAKVAIAEIVQCEILKKTAKRKNKAVGSRMARYLDSERSKQKAPPEPAKTSSAVVAGAVSPAQNIVRPSEAPSMPLTFSSVPRTRPRLEAIVEARPGKSLCNEII